MGKLESKNLDAPDDTRSFDKGKLDLVTIGEFVCGRATFQPGWKWSESVKPIAGTDSCQTHHKGFVQSGRLHIVMDDGQETEAGPGTVYEIPPGHDAWVVGNEPVIAYDFSPGAATYAKK